MNILLLKKKIPPYPLQTTEWEVYVAVKRLSRCYISIDLLKIEPGHFPEAELRFQPQDWARHEQVQVGDCGMKTMGHQSHCLCAAV